MKVPSPSSSAQPTRLAPQQGLSLLGWSLLTSSSTKTTSQCVLEGFSLAEQALLHPPSPRSSRVAAAWPEGQWLSKGWHWGIVSPACSPQVM